MIINILGTEYVLQKCKASFMSDEDNYGECDRYAKTIMINTEIYDKEGMTDYPKDVMKKTIRHEIFHAFFHEAGLDCYSEDEILVDALAILFPKIEKAIKEGEDD